MTRSKRKQLTALALCLALTATSAQELDSMYAVLQRLQLPEPAYNFVHYVGNVVTNGLYLETTAKPEKQSKVDIGSLASMIGCNDVEGWHFGAGLRTTAALHKHWYGKAFLSYGTRDERLKGMVEATYSFNDKKRTPDERPCRTLTATYTNDVKQPMAMYETMADPVSITGLKWNHVRQMMYVERVDLRFDWETDGGLRLKVQGRKEWNEAAGQLYYKTLSGVSVSQFTLSEGTVGLEYKPQGKYAPTIAGSHTGGAWGISHEAHAMNYTELTLQQQVPLGKAGHMDCTLATGAQWNKVPFILLGQTAASPSYVASERAFRLIGTLEYLYDRHAALLALWDFEGRLMHRSPLLKQVGATGYVGGNVLVGRLTDKNNPTLPANEGSDRLFEMQTLSSVLTAPYAELVCGVHNIFKMIGFEYVERLTSCASHSHRRGVRLTLNVKL